MPNVTIAFDKSKVSQTVITALKVALPVIVSEALNDHTTVTMPEGFDSLSQFQPKEIRVTQEIFHETDVNTVPIDIHILAGVQQGRSAKKVRLKINKGIRGTEIVSAELLESKQMCIWLHFSPNNDFGFV